MNGYAKITSHRRTVCRSTGDRKHDCLQAACWIRCRVSPVGMCFHSEPGFYYPAERTGGNDHEKNTDKTDTAAGRGHYYIFLRNPEKI